MDDVILTVDSQRHLGWTEVRITRSLDYVAHSFELTLTEKWAAGVGSGQPRSIVAGMPCKVSIDNQLLISGYVDEVLPSYNATQHSIQVIGRSKAGDLVDSSLEGKTFQNQTLLQIAKALATPFGLNVSVAAGTSVGDPFRSARLDPGQPIYEFLEELARIRAVRFISDERGNLIITRAGTASTNSRLQLGINIREAGGSLSLRDRYTQYTAIAQQDNELGSAAYNAQVSETAKDDWGRFHRYRPHTFLVESAADAAAAQQRADWQRRTAYGRSQGITYTVTGWRQENGELWTYNTLLPIVDPWTGIDGQRLIVETSLILDENGRRTQLRVMPKEAYDLVPLPEPESGELEFLF